MAHQHTFYANYLVDALLEEGIPNSQIWLLDGWKENQQGYYWTDIHTDQHHGYDGVASGHLNHHTASVAYTPYVRNSKGQTKANVWVGKRPPGSGRLYQNCDGVPTLAVASAGPANYSAGAGVRDYIKALNASTEALKQTKPDDTPTFYGNRYVWNTEIVCNGVGGMIDQDTWDLLIVYNTALSRLHDAGPAFNGFHAGFTRRKIDYRDGRFGTASLTIQQMWREIQPVLDDQGGNVYQQFVTGIVTGWAEDLEKTRHELERLYDAGILEGTSKLATVDYWIGMLDTPHDAAWLGFYARTELSAWGR